MEESDFEADMLAVHALETSETREHAPNRLEASDVVRVLVWLSFTPE